MALADEFGRQLAEDLNNAESRAERGEIIRFYEKYTGFSAGTLYREAKRFGWKMERKTRADKETLKDGLTREQIERLAQLWTATRDKKYKIPRMPKERVIQIAENEGIIPSGILTAPRLNRIFKEMGLGQKDLRAERDKGDPIRLKTEHPNDWWFADTTICRQWYLENGKIRHQCLATEDYRNKEGPGTGRPKLIRYMVVDHASGAFYVKYASEERALPMAEFLFEAFSPKPNINLEPMRGVPWGLFGDNGSVNRAGSIQNMLKRMGIEWKAHLPGNPRAKGAVEVMLDKWEQWFETGLKLQPAMTLEEINEWVIPLRQFWNSSRLHSRHGMTRSVAWNMIPEAKLRMPPDYAIYQKLVTAASTFRKVQPGRIINFEGMEYQIGGQKPTKEMITLVGEKVEIFKSPYKWDEENRLIEVLVGDSLYEVEPIAKNIFGFPLQAAEIGKEFKRQPDTQTQQELKKIGVVDGKRQEVPIAELRKELNLRGNIFHIPKEKFTNVALMPKKGASMLIDMMQRKMTRLQGLEELERLLGRDLTGAESQNILARMSAEGIEKEVSNEWIKNIAEEIKGVKKAIAAEKNLG